MHIRIGNTRKVVAQPPADRAERSQAAFRVVVVAQEMPPHQRLDRVVILGQERALLAQDLPERLVLVENPRVHRRDQLIARDEVQLQGDDAEEQVAVGDVMTRRHGGGSKGQARSVLPKDNRRVSRK